MLLFLCIDLIICFSMVLACDVIIPHPAALDDYRLPPWYTPLDYIIEMKFHIERNNSLVNATSSCHLIANHNTDIIFFHALDLDISSVIVIEIATGKMIKVTKFENFCSREALGIYMESEMIKDNKYIVSIAYSVKPSSVNLYGIYETWYKNEKGTIETSIVTQFQPVDARRAFPCFDEPGIKAFFKMTIIHRNDMVALSNMPALTSHDLGGGWNKTEFLPTLKMSTYLLAFFVGRFQKNGLDNIAVYSQPKLVNTMTLARDISFKIMESFNKMFQISQGVSKIDLIAVPQYAHGAMENWGLITFNEKYLTFHEDTTDLETAHFIKIIVSHELAHTWFGNLVTCKWWDILFIQEGIVSFLEILGVVIVNPDLNADTLIILDSHFPSLQKDNQDNRRVPIIQTNVSEPRLIEKVFSYATYSKASCVFRMLLYHIGKTAFLEGLRHFLSTYRFGTVGTEELYHSFDITCGKHCEEWKNVTTTDFMKSWTHYSGHPAISFLRDYDDGSAILIQKFYLEPKNKNPNIFSIPITYTTANEQNWEPKTRFFMDRKKMRLENLAGEKEWVIVNLQMAGLYRVQYDIQNWKMIMKQLAKAHEIIPTLNRAMILHDLGTYALRDPLIYMRMYLDLTRYLYFERELAPWIVFLSETRSIQIALYEDLETRRNWVDYLIYLMSSVYQEYYWNESNYENVVDKESAFGLRNRIIHMMCILGDVDCNRYALALFRDWRDVRLAKIPVDFKKIAYCNGLYYGTASDWDLMTKHYEGSPLDQEKYRVLSAVLCARKKEIFYETKMKGILTQLPMETRESVAGYFEAFMNHLSISTNLTDTSKVDINDFYYNSFVSLHKNKDNYIYDIHQQEFEEDFYDTAKILLKYKKEVAAIAVQEFVEELHLNGVEYFAKMRHQRTDHPVKPYDNSHLLMNSLLD